MTSDEVWTIGLALGKGHRGAVGAWELRAKNVDRKALGRLVRRRKVHRLWYGMYVFGPPTDEAKASAAIKHAKQRDVTAATPWSPSTRPCGGT